MRIRPRSLWHVLAKLLLLCPALVASAWLYTSVTYSGETITPLRIAQFWPILIYVLCLNMTVTAIPLLGGSATLLFLYLRASTLRRSALLLLLQSIWLPLLPWVMQACFFSLYFRDSGY